MYNQVIVVEGKNDQERIARLFPESLIITTNGSEVSSDTISTLKTLSDTFEIILLLDPDYPGERIRSLITNQVKNVKHAFIQKELAISKNKRKVGVEHATDEIIIESLSKLLTLKNQMNNVTLNTLVKLNLAGSKKSAILRNKVARSLNIGAPNAKTFLKRVNALGLTFENLEEIILEVTNEENRNN